MAIVLFILAYASAVRAELSTSFQSPGNIEGLVAAVYTPLHQNGSLNLSPAQLDAQARYLNETTVGTAFVSGTTGESVDLTVAERISLMEAWVAPCHKYGLKLMVHVGTDAVDDARKLASHAERVGAWGIAAMPPTYIKPSSVQMLAQTLDYIARAAPRTPFYYYHIPSMTGVTFKMADLLDAITAGDGGGGDSGGDADVLVPTLNGIKFTHYDFSDLLACVKFDRGRFAAAAALPSGGGGGGGGSLARRSLNMLYGTDAMLLSALVVGVHGAVGSTYNFNGIMERRIMDAFDRGDLAAAADAQYGVIGCLAATLSAVPGVNGGKALQNLIGRATGGAMDVGPPRLPQHAPTDAEIAQLRNSTVAWCARSHGAAPWCQYFV